MSATRKLEIYEDVNGKFGIVDLLGGERGQAELSKADATLFAAAPDLLEALIALTRQVDENRPVSKALERATQAIAKATGAMP